MPYYDVCFPQFDCLFLDAKKTFVAVSIDQYFCNKMGQSSKVDNFAEKVWAHNFRSFRNDDNMLKLGVQREGE